MIQESLEQLKKSLLADAPSAPHKWTRKEAHLVIPGPWKEDGCFYIDLATMEAFKVDRKTNVLSEQEIYDNWELVEKADRKETKQFVDCSIWKIKEHAKMGRTPIDAIWIRKWKRMADGTLVVKSRLCARGFLDSQTSSLATRATTATKLSQKLLLALSQVFGFKLESWDVSGAFLKGFPFREIEERLKKRGLVAPRREVSIRPPANVWRHLREIKGSNINISELDSWWFVLECVKAMYGLNDAPLAWQIALQEFLVSREGIQSSFDDCFFFWPERPGIIIGMCTCHVDDNAVTGKDDWLETEFNAFSNQLGGATRNKLPFTHCGIKHVLGERGLKHDQDEFCQKLQPFSINKERANKSDAALTPDELSGLRTVLGGLLWLCQTRLDIICEVVLAQQEVARATIQTLKNANAALTRAKKYAKSCGLVYPRIRTPLKLFTVGDSSHATRTSAYAQEGCIILLMND